MFNEPKKGCHQNYCFHFSYQNMNVPVLFFFSRTTFKEFCVRYQDDQRFSTLTRKKEQEVLFSHYITALKKREKENRTRLRKMR